MSLQLNSEEELARTRSTRLIIGIEKDWREGVREEPPAVSARVLLPPLFAQLGYDEPKARHHPFPQFGVQTPSPHTSLSQDATYATLSNE